MFRSSFRKRCKMLMKIGLTLVLVSAIGLYYLAEKYDGAANLMGWKLDGGSLEDSEIPVEMGQVPHSGDKLETGAGEDVVNQKLDKTEIVAGHKSDKNSDKNEANIDKEQINHVNRSKVQPEESNNVRQDTQGSEHEEKRSDEKIGIQKGEKENLVSIHADEDDERTDHIEADVQLKQKLGEVNNDIKIPKHSETKEEIGEVADNSNQSDLDEMQESVEAAIKEAEEKAAVEDAKIEAQKQFDVAMHLAVVACGDRLDETLVMIKSALIFNQQFLHIHIFADDDLQPLFRQKLDSVPPDVHQRFQYHIHDIQFPAGTKPDEWRSLFKTCATQRLFIPDILTDVPKLIYVDTDVLFLRPIDDVWAFFNDFNSSQLAALAWEHEDGSAGWYNRFARHPYYPPFGVNSGVMLMDLPMIRAANWTSLMKEYYREYKLRITWGDQDLINIFFHHYPEKLYIFRCPYNYRPDHCMYMQTCKPVLTEGVSVLHGCRIVFHNEKQVTFKAIYNAFDEYQFGDPLKTHLLMTIKANLDDVVGSADRCAKESDFFTKQLAWSIKNVKPR